MRGALGRGRGRGRGDFRGRGRGFGRGAAGPATTENGGAKQEQ